MRNTSLLASLLTAALSAVVLSAAPAQSTLFGTEVQLDDLGSIDRGTGSWTLIGDQGIGGSITGLAYDGNNDVLYGCSPSTDCLYVLDASTGLATLVGATGFSNINGLAYDSGADTLYCTDLNNNALFTIDVNTGVGTLVGTITGASFVEGLAYDPAGDVLYGLDDGADTIVTLDRVTAAATPLANALGSSGLWRGLTWDSEQGVLWVTKVNPGELYSVDPAVGSGSFVGGPGTFVQGLAFRDGSAGGIAISITGACPGPMTLLVDGATHGGSVAIAYARGRGNFTVPNGQPCAGTVLGLSGMGITLAAVVGADASGNASLPGNVPASACGRISVQAVDLSTCTTSNVIDL